MTDISGFRRQLIRMIMRNIERMVQSMVQITGADRACLRDRDAVEESEVYEL